MENKPYEQLLDTWHERAEQFSKDYADAQYEMGMAQNFMRSLCEIYDAFSITGVLFEEKLKKAGDDGGINRIDGFLPELLLIEMKSAGKNPEIARQQAFGYIDLLRENKRETEIPRYVLVSDFKRLHLYDRTISDTEGTTIELADFRNHVEKFAFLYGYERIVERRQEAVNTLAAEKLAALHDAIKATGYTGKELENLLVRILFCLFAEDTGLFGKPDLFKELINNTREDGRDLYGELDMLFTVLDSQNRKSSVFKELLAFPYVNGKLFDGRLPHCYFTSDTRKILLSCAADVDWSQISPAIFGSLFQFIMHDEGDTATKSKKRREFGAHYTSEKNILKTIGPLFLDSLKKELKACKGEYGRLEAYLKKLRRLRIFDPACGCGNFLVVAYREIRLLEEQALNEVKKGQMSLDMPLCNVNQFFGIEIDPSAAQIATLALWLTDHQMNMRVRQPDGKPYIRLPLTAKANIVCGNALQLDWNSVIKAEECSYIVGNPPFVGYSNQNKEQQEDTKHVFDGIDGAGVLDYVAGWYVKAATFTKENPDISAAFVSTNSIAQGEQVTVLWKYLLAQGVHIHFAHRTFRWSNEGKGVAAVHCVIIGFGLDKPKRRVIFEYPDISGDPQTIKAKNINPYLVDAPTLLIEKRRKPLCDNVPEMVYGSKPTDGGFLLLSQESADKIRAHDPIAAKYIKRFLNADEFINDVPRYCLWLEESTEEERKNSPELKERIAHVRQMRLDSPKIPTQKLAATAYLFGEIRQTEHKYLLVPRHSSENRRYVPIGYFDKDVICGDANFTLPNATLYHFAIVTSIMHMAWMKVVCGRIKSDYRYSNTIVYNNFPWPKKLTEEQQQTVTDKAQKVLDVRNSHVGQTLAWMYNPETMPDDLLKAHRDLDDAVDAAYGYTGKTDDAARVAFLFKLYGEFTQ